MLMCNQLTSMLLIIQKSYSSVEAYGDGCGDPFTFDVTNGWFRNSLADGRFVWSGSNVFLKKSLASFVTSAGISGAHEDPI